MKKVGLLCMWLLATAAAVAVASAGVNIVSNEVIEPAPADVTASVISSPAAEAPPTSLVPSTAPAAPTTTPAPPPDAQPSSTAPPSTTQAGAPTTTAPTTVVTTPTTSAPPVNTTSTTPTTTPTTTSPPPTTTIAAATTLTFQLVGGSTAISFAPDAVIVAWAEANPGFEVSIEPEDDGIKVEFRSENHRSRVDAWWDDGPTHEIREEADD